MSAPPVSFGFSKKVAPRKLVDSRLRDESTKDEEEETDFVRSVIGNEIQGSLKVKVEKKKEWIIPLIKQNKWRGRQDTDEPSNENTERVKIEEAAGPVIDTLSPEERLEKQALKELLDEAGNVESTETMIYEVPLLLQNRIPGGFEQDDNMDVSLRPEQSSLEDYEEFPVEHFGMAMLRGMGWTETEGIGRTNKGVIALQEPMLRPKGLGLGAERPQSNKDAVSVQSAKKGESKLILKIGARAKITHGSNKGFYGRVESFDEDNNRVILKLTLTSKMADISKFHMEVVSESEFNEKSRVLNNERYEEYRQVHDERDAAHRENRLRTDSEFLQMSSQRQRESGRDHPEDQRRPINGSRRDHDVDNSRNKRKYQTDNSRDGRNDQVDNSRDERSQRVDNSRDERSQRVDNSRDERSHHRSKDDEYPSSSKKSKSSKKTCRNRSSSSSSVDKKSRHKKKHRSNSSETSPDNKKSRHKKKRRSNSPDSSPDDRKSRHKKKRRSNSPDSSPDDRKSRHKKKRRSSSSPDDRKSRHKKKKRRDPS